MKTVRITPNMNVPPVKAIFICFSVSMALMILLGWLWFCQQSNWLRTGFFPTTHPFWVNRPPVKK